MNWIMKLPFKFLITLLITIQSSLLWSQKELRVIVTDRVGNGISGISIYAPTFGTKQTGNFGECTLTSNSNEFSPGTRIQFSLKSRDFEPIIKDILIQHIPASSSDVLNLVVVKKNEKENDIKKIVKALKVELEKYGNRIDSIDFDINRLAEYIYADTAVLSKTDSKYVQLLVKQGSLNDLKDLLQDKQNQYQQELERAETFTKKAKSLELIFEANKIYKFNPSYALRMVQFADSLFSTTQSRELLKQIISSHEFTKITTFVHKGDRYPEITLEFSPSDSFLLSYNYDRPFIKIWNLQANCIDTLFETSATFLHKRDIILTENLETKRLKVFSIDGTKLFEEEGESIFASSNDKFLMTRNPKTKKLKVFSVNGKRLFEVEGDAIFVSPNETFFIVQTNNTKFSLYDSNFKFVKDFSGHFEWFNPKREQILYKINKLDFHLYDMGVQKEVCHLQSKWEYDDFFFSNRGNYLIQKSTQYSWTVEGKPINKTDIQESFSGFMDDTTYIVRQTYNTSLHNINGKQILNFDVNASIIPSPDGKIFLLIDNEEYLSKGYSTVKVYTRAGKLLWAKQDVEKTIWLTENKLLLKDNRGMGYIYNTEGVLSHELKIGIQPTISHNGKYLIGRPTKDFFVLHNLHSPYFFKAKGNLVAYNHQSNIFIVSVNMYSTELNEVYDFNYNLVHSFFGYSSSITPDGRYIIYKDSYLKNKYYVYNIKNKKTLELIANQCHYSKNYDSFLLENNGFCEMVDNTGKSIRRIEKKGYFAKVSPSEKFVLFFQKGKLEVFDFLTFKPFRTFQCDSYSISPNDSFLIKSNSKKSEVVNLYSNRKLIDIDRGNAYFTNNSSFIYSTIYEKRTSYLDVLDFKKNKTFKVSGSSVYSVDSTFIVTTDSGRDSTHYYSLEGKPIYGINGQLLKFSGDKKYLITLNGNGRINYCSNTGICYASYDSEKLFSSINGVISPDNNYLILSKDGNISVVPTPYAILFTNYIPQLNQEQIEFLGIGEFVKK